LILLFITVCVLTFGIVGLDDMAKIKENPYIIAGVAICVVTAVVCFFTCAIAYLCSASEAASGAAGAERAQRASQASQASQSVVINIPRQEYGSLGSAAA
jgi:hypothetical protein